MQQLCNKSWSICLQFDVASIIATFYCKAASIDNAVNAFKSNRFGLVGRFIFSGANFTANNIFTNNKNKLKAF